MWGTGMWTVVQRWGLESETRERMSLMDKSEACGTCLFLSSSSELYSVHVQHAAGSLDAALKSQEPLLAPSHREGEEREGGGRQKDNSFLVVFTEKMFFS